MTDRCAHSLNQIRTLNNLDYIQRLCHAATPGRSVEDRMTALDVAIAHPTNRQDPCLAPRQSRLKDLLTKDLIISPRCVGIPWCPHIH